MKTVLHTRDAEGLNKRLSLDPKGRLHLTVWLEGMEPMAGLDGRVHANRERELVEEMSLDAAEGALVAIDDPWVNAALAKGA